MKQVQVEGTDLYPDETIRQWVLNDDYSWNTLYVFLKYKFKDAEEMPFLQQPEVRIKGPHSLSIKVREKRLPVISMSRQWGRMPILTKTV